MSIKLKDVAQSLGISPATVSLALNGKPGISETTRQRIFSVIREMGHPELLPVDSNASKSIHFIIYKDRNVIVSETPFFFQLMEGIEIRCRYHGYKLMISYVNESNNTTEYISSLIQKDCAGILLLATEMRTADLAPFSNLSLPFVILDSYFEREKYDCIAINNTHGAYDATDYLIRNGHTKIGYLQSSYRIKNFSARYQGFIKALDAHKIPLEPSYILKLGSSMETSYYSMCEYLKSDFAMPTAFFADNDLIALGAIKALKEHNYEVPGDISIIGFDNTPLSQATEPNLTTVNVPKQRMGVLAVDRLVSRINETPEEFIKLEVGTTLVIRDSVKSL